VTVRKRIPGSTTTEIPWLTVSDIREKTRENGYYFDRKAANKIIHFFEHQIRHVQGELGGQLVVLERWQKRFLRRAFGWMNETGARVVRELWIEIPRKNGKSFLASGLALYLFLADKEPGCRVVCAAADTDQASQVYDVAYGNVIMNRKILDRVGKPYQQKMRRRNKVDQLAVISSRASTKHGSNLHGVIIDEVHVHPDRELIDVLVTSTSSRRQPMTVYLTTAGEIGENAGWELHQYGQMVLDREIEDHSFYAVIYGADENDDWTDEEVWYKANPNLGVSKKLDYMRTQCGKAKMKTSRENKFKQLELNIWTEQSTRWIPMVRFDQCPKEIDYQSLLKQDCFVGLDLASTTDMASVCFLFPTESATFEDDNDTVILSHNYQAIWKYYLPEGRLELVARKYKAMYEAWRDQGVLTLTPGDIIDYSFIRQELIDASGIYNLREIAADPWNATQLLTQLSEVDGFQVVPWRQGFATMSAPSKEFEALVLSRRLNHGGNPIFRWNVKSCAKKEDAAGNIKPDKEKSANKIDGVVSCINALGRAMVHVDYNIYDHRGLKTI
jgi:phage terminase large subunit-like protein